MGRMQTLARWGLQLGCAAALVLGIAEGDAMAKASYKAAIPNPEAFDCDTCHVPGETPAADQLNLFGLDVQLLVDEPQGGWWETLCVLDSDLDGQVNGQELGDPCNNWFPGQDPWRTDEISAPGDVISLSLTPDVGCEPPMGMGGMGGMPMGGMGGMPSGAGGMASGAGGAGATGGVVDDTSNDADPDSDPQARNFESAPQSACHATPGPVDASAWALLSLGLGLVVASRRRRRS